MDGRKASPSSSICPWEYEVFLSFYDEDAKHNFIDHLYAIMKCRKEMGKIVFPVFHHVDPSHVRNQTGSCREWIANHERKGFDKKKQR
ncbi:hypothetical protein AAG906_012208 [Vitis piasezkii]